MLIWKLARLELEKALWLSVTGYKGMTLPCQERKYIENINYYTTSKTLKTSSFLVKF